MAVAVSCGCAILLQAAQGIAPESVAVMSAVLEETVPIKVMFLGAYHVSADVDAKRVAGTINWNTWCQGR